MKNRAGCSEAANDSRRAQDPATHSRRLSPGIDTFWEEETGLIVLEAEGRLFSAQRSVLRHESTIFRDMLSLPQPPVLDKKEQYEGKPLIRLSDKAEELQCFLKALHHYREYYESSSSDTFASKAAILRLSHKYEVAHLRTRTIKELSSHFPTSLEKYDKWLRKQKKLQLEGLPDAEPTLLSAVEEVGVQRFLPFINYIRCTRVPISRSRPSNDTVSSAIPTLLLRQFEINQIITHQSCYDLREGRDDYIESCAARMHLCFQSSLDIDHVDPLDNISVFKRVNKEDPTADGQLCAKCKNASQASFVEKRSKLWDDLPAIFGLPSWEELLAEE